MYDLNTDLNVVRDTIRTLFEGTPLADLLQDPSALLSNHGKMLRARMIIHLGRANQIDPDQITRTGTAIELIHTASLLHDDVIDQGELRRNAPAFWTRHGTPGAILLGDLLMFYALKTLNPLTDRNLSQTLLAFAGEVAEAEVQQELLLRGSSSTWEDCLKTARHKTGPLFAFLGYAAGNDDDQPLRDALTECGYLLGTAYQLADDLLDAYGNDAMSGKSVNRDSLRGKKTAAVLFAEKKLNPADFLNTLLQESRDLLRPWPHILQAWNNYLTQSIEPLINQQLLLIPAH